MSFAKVFNLNQCRLVKDLIKRMLV